MRVKLEEYEDRKIRWDLRWDFMVLLEEIRKEIFSNEEDGDLRRVLWCKPEDKKEMFGKIRYGDGEWKERRKIDWKKEKSRRWKKD
ncbi:hypothetical protein Tco_1314909 [Tanacetum coccineum]